MSWPQIGNILRKGKPDDPGGGGRDRKTVRGRKGVEALAASRAERRRLGM